ncbi:MAG TPA: aldo/keto reductase [Candidatus Dormibacteraeota bacterium]
MTLPTRPLGASGMDITRVGFGAWAIGGAGWSFGWGAQDDDEAVAAIRAAVEHGINWIDTAAVYGLGHSEELVARALRDIPDAGRPLVFTKCGLVWDPQHPDAAPRRVARPDSLRRELEDSLRRLGVEQIDLYQLHWPPEDGTPVEEYWAAMLDLERQGTIRAAGLSNHGVELLERAEALGHVDSVQPPLSLIDRRAAADVIPWAAAHDTGVIVYSPMHSGLLTGAFDRSRAAALPPDDWRSRNPDFSGDRLERNLALVEALQPVADRHDVGVGAVAVAWALAWPGVTGAIVGARRPEQIDGWIAAGELELTDDDLDEIALALERTRAGEGPIRPIGSAWLT